MGRDQRPVGRDPVAGMVVVSRDRRSSGRGAQQRRPRLSAAADEGGPVGTLHLAWVAPAPVAERGRAWLEAGRARAAHVEPDPVAVREPERAAVAGEERARSLQRQQRVARLAVRRVAEEHVGAIEAAYRDERMIAGGGHHEVVHLRAADDAPAPGLRIGDRDLAAFDRDGVGPIDRRAVRPRPGERAERAWQRDLPVFPRGSDLVRGEDATRLIDRMDGEPAGLRGVVSFEDGEGGAALGRHQPLQRASRRAPDRPASSVEDRDGAVGGDDERVVADPLQEVGPKRARRERRVAHDDAAVDVVERDVVLPDREGEDHAVG
jgi:hypothetical protein